MKIINRKKKLIVTIAIILIVVILAIIVTTNIINNNKKVANEGYFATTSNANSNLVASYIKKGISIGGITGTLEVLDTSDATATAADILNGKTAYVNGEKITGTFTSNASIVGKSTGQANNVYVSCKTSEQVSVGIVIANIAARQKDSAIDTMPVVTGGNLTELSRSYIGTYCGSSTVIYLVKDLPNGSTLTTYGTQYQYSNHLAATLVVIKIM